MDEAHSLVKEVLNVPENYDVLFWRTSLGFLKTAYNMMRTNDDRCLITGHGLKAALG